MTIIKNLVLLTLHMIRYLHSCNYEDQRTGSADNRVDPMNIIPEWRDPFPKTNLDGKGNIVYCHIINLLMLCAH